MDQIYNENKLDTQLNDICDFWNTIFSHYCIVCATHNIKITGEDHAKRWEILKVLKSEKTTNSYSIVELVGLVNSVFFIYNKYGILLFDKDLKYKDDLLRILSDKQ